MKKSLITIAIVLLAVAVQAQIKMHSNGLLTFQTLSTNAGQGVSIGPGPDWITNFNGNVHFNNSAFFNKNPNDYGWINCAYATHGYAAAWVIAYPNWNTTTFFVYANGDAYARHHYLISGSLSEERAKRGESEAINGSDALQIVTGLKGYYHAPEEQEIPDLENNEFVAPEAVEAMYADFGKRSVGLSGDDFVEAFPEGVRTDPQNRLCISYSSVVTMLVEAVKEQQREIEELRSTLEENGLMKK